MLTSILLALETLGNATQIGTFLFVLRHQGGQGKYGRQFCGVKPLTVNQGILKGDVWLVWNQLYDNWQFVFLFAKRLNQTSQTGGQLYSDTSPFSVPWLS
jgi:hypothetical protein